MTFANGSVVREQIVDIDDTRHRLVYAVVEWRPKHHNASMQVFPEGEGRTRLVWITDLLPNDLAGPVGALVEQGASVIKQTLARRREACK